MVGQALAPVAAGILLGLGATEWLRPLAEAQFYEVETQNPLMLAVVAASVLASALLAAYLPARRAGNVDPIVVLRQE
jgi:putative ABC transport system permease protein